MYERSATGSGTTGVGALGASGCEEALDGDKLRVPALDLVLRVRGSPRALLHVAGALRLRVRL